MSVRGKLAIQHFYLHWGKGSRGMPGSGVRNALPRDLPFHPPSDTERGWYHRIEYSAWDNFAPRESWSDIGRIEPWRIPLSIRMEGDHHLWLRFDVSKRDPCRPNLEKWIVRLPYGQRATFRSNSKADGDHDRWYFENVFHVGWADTPTLDLPLFRTIDERALLY